MYKKTLGKTKKCAAIIHCNTEFTEIILTVSSL